jgi:cytochrome c biogenesis protein CcmG/thiol:disulfide interchange protein DsbE
MKKTGSIIYWTVIGVLVIVIAYILYNRYKPEIDLEQPPQQSIEHSDRNKEDSGEDKKEDESQPEEDGQEEKLMAPEFALETLNGDKVKLSDYKGKLVFLNFWAVWCRHCVQEMPDLDSANTVFMEGDDAVILAIDVQESKDAVSEFMKEKGITLPILMDYDGQVAAAYGVTGLPTTYLIDRDGSIIGRKVGPMTETQIINLVEEYK